MYSLIYDVPTRIYLLYCISIIYVCTVPTVSPIWYNIHCRLSRALIFAEIYNVDCRYKWSLIYGINIPNYTVYLPYTVSKVSHQGPHYGKIYNVDLNVV